MENNLNNQILLLDGHLDHAIAIGAELKRALDVRILAAGHTKRCGLLRSRYADKQVILPRPGSSEYGKALLHAIRKLRPAVVLPVSFASVEALNSIRAVAEAETKFAIPPDKSLRMALSKRETLKQASALGLRVPQDYTEEFNKSEVPKGLSFPIFLKLASEVGDNVTSLVVSPGQLIAEYRRLADLGYGDDILLQEFIDGDESTYGCAMLYLDGVERLAFQHREVRSVPRNGGSGTRVELYNDDALVHMTRMLLNSLEWNGPALVEYKKDRDGNYVLMEINPKYWASYAFSSRNGCYFAAETVASLMRRKASVPKVRMNVPQMVFPIRELLYVMKNRDQESIIRAICAMVIPPARPDFYVKDIAAYIDYRWLSRLR